MIFFKRIQKTGKGSGIAIILIGLIGASVSGEPAGVKDFGWSMELLTTPGYPVYEVEIPGQVYQGVASEDLDDIRVYDSQDKMVSHLVQKKTPALQKNSRREYVPVFPVYRLGGVKSSNLSIRVRKNPYGSIVEIDNSDNNENGAGNAAKKIIDYYILDNTKTENGFNELELEWKGNDNGVYEVTLEGSDDFEYWDTILAHAPVFRMSYQGHSIAKSALVFSSHTYKYLRVIASNNAADFVLQKARLKYETESAKTIERQWKKITEAGRDGRAFVYDTGGKMPIDRIRLSKLPVNSGSDVEIYARASEKEEWKFCKKVFVYNMSLGNKNSNKNDNKNGQKNVASEDIEISETSKRYWKFEVVGQAWENPPVVEFGWFAHMLVFLDSENPPFRMLYGNPQLTRIDFKVGRLIAQIEEREKRPLEKRQAQAGKITIVKGDMTSSGNFLFNKLNVLWAVLVGAVAFMLYMAKSLYTQIQKD